MQRCSLFGFSERTHEYCEARLAEIVRSDARRDAIAYVSEALLTIVAGAAMTRGEIARVALRRS